MKLVVVVKVVARRGEKWRFGKAASCVTATVGASVVRARAGVRVCERMCASLCERVCLCARARARLRVGVGGGRSEVEVVIMVEEGQEEVGVRSSKGAVL